MLTPARHRADDPATVTLETMRDRYRPLLVFAPTDKDPDFLRQLHLVAADQSELQEREVLLVPLTSTSEARPACVPGTSAHMEPEAAAAARRRFHIPPDSFTVLLLGKDGGEKLRSQTPIPIRTLLQTIDSMPMRQQEIHDRHTEPKTP